MSSTAALLWLAIEPRTPAEAHTLAQALERMTLDDAGLHIQTTGGTAGSIVIGGGSEEHLEAIVARLKREFDVEASVGCPRVAYREAITRPADGEAKHIHETDGRGEYAHVKLRVYPGEPGTDCVIENDISGGAIPAAFVGAVSEGIRNTLVRGVIGGHPLDGVRVTMYDGSYHDADSTERAFRIAGALAAADAVGKAAPVVLEPVMRVEVHVPAECLDDVMSDLGSRRGRIRSQQEHGDFCVVDALVPLAQLFGYAVDLRSRTRGRGTWTMRFEEYVPLPTVDGGGDRDSIVGAPRQPAPPLRSSRIALPEPDDDILDS